MVQSVYEANQIDELSSQHPYAMSVRGNIYVCGEVIDGLPVAGFVWTTGYTVHF